MKEAYGFKVAMELIAKMASTFELTIIKDVMTVAMLDGSRTRGVVMIIPSEDFEKFPLLPEGFEINFTFEGADFSKMIGNMSDNEPIVIRLKERHVEIISLPAKGNMIVKTLKSESPNEFYNPISNTDGLFADHDCNFVCGANIIKQVCADADAYAVDGLLLTMGPEQHLKFQASGIKGDFFSEISTNNLEVYMCEDFGHIILSPVFLKDVNILGKLGILDFSFDDSAHLIVKASLYSNGHLIYIIAGKSEEDDDEMYYGDFNDKDYAGLRRIAEPTKKDEDDIKEATEQPKKKAEKTTKKRTKKTTKKKSTTKKN